VRQRRVFLDEDGLLVGRDGVLELEQENVLDGARHGDR
jgi:hypothetical protein